MEFVIRPAILFEQGDFRNIGGFGSSVRGLSTHWRHLVARGNFEMAWDLEGYDNDCLLAEVVDKELFGMVINPEWLNQYQAFRTWVWNLEFVWLADGWSLYMGAKYPVFGTQIPFIIEGNHALFDGKYWLLDVEFVPVPAEKGLDVSCVRMLNNDDVDLLYSNDVSSPVDLISEVLSMLLNVLDCEARTMGYWGWKLWGSSAFQIFIPSMGPLICFDLGFRQANNQMCELGMGVNKWNSNAEDGSPLLNIEIGFADGIHWFHFSGPDGLKYMCTAYNVNMPPWYYE